MASNNHKMGMERVWGAEFLPSFHGQMFSRAYSVSVCESFQSRTELERSSSVVSTSSDPASPGEFVAGRDGFDVSGKKDRRESLDGEPDHDGATSAIPRNTISPAPAEEFFVRGHGYLKGKKVVDKTLKSPSAPSPYDCMGVNVFRAKKSMQHLASKLDSLQEYLAHHGKNDPLANSPYPQFLVINWLFKNTWTKEHICVAHLFKRNDVMVDELDEGFVRAFSSFTKGNKRERSERFKFIFKVREASGAIKKSISAMGGEKPVIIARKLTTTFHDGPNYIEINQDVGSSMIASMLNSTLLKTSKGTIIDVSWCCEAKDETELPERILAAIRFNWVDFQDVCVNLDDKFNIVPSS